MIIFLIIIIVCLIIWSGIREDNAYQRGRVEGMKWENNLINLKIRQDGYILDGKRVRKTMDEKDI